MKKVINLSTVFFISILFISCSSDDDSSVESIVGKWQIEQMFKNNVSENISECKKKSTLEFKDDTTFISTPYVLFNGDCIIDGISSGTWRDTGNNNLEVKVSGETESDKAVYSFSNGKLMLEYTGESTIYIRIN